MKITYETVLLLKVARKEGQELGAISIQVPHVLLAISLASDTMESRALSDAGLTPDKIRSRLVEIHGELDRNPYWIRLDAAAKQLKADAAQYAADHGHRVVKPRDLLMAVIQSPEGASFIGGAGKVHEIRSALKNRKAGARVRKTAS